jgi:superoxide dismutase, Fe-Mn family
MSPHALPPLPYALNALAPHISAETLDYHHSKHHRAYVDKLNELVSGTAYECLSLEAIVQSAKGPIFNNAAQVWNHTFYWNSLAPEGGGEPSGELAQTLGEKFGSVAKFKAAFSTAAIGALGSGWTWLVAESDGSLAIRTTSNAQTPLNIGAKPLLTCDVWEHAYYIDHRNSRPKYLEAFWAVVNWKFAARNFKH